MGKHLSCAGASALKPGMEAEGCERGCGWAKANSGVSGHAAERKSGLESILEKTLS